jgi:heme exporter protein D
VPTNARIDRATPGAEGNAVNDFLSMGGYGFYVWGAYGVTALAIALEIISVRARWRAAKKQARS